MIDPDRVLTSRDNAHVKHLRALAHDARARREAGQTVLDGPHLVDAALGARAKVVELVVAEPARTRVEVQEILGRWNGPTTVLAGPLFAWVSPVESPTGILAILAVPPRPALGDAIGDWVVLDRIQDAGNVGTILRTAAAAGVGTVILTPGCAQAWSPKVLRAGMGAHFVLDIIEADEGEDILVHFHGIRLATGVGAGARSLYDWDLRGPVAWLLGSEGQGLSSGLLAQAQGQVVIPMTVGVESLNVGAAAAICLFEQVRQRQGR
ncbi:MAG: RNA methyltransferase [Zoogloeaceae bacterium]|nr:RNA methyltransferase [Zoogloeaceae bacterium]